MCIHLYRYDSTWPQIKDKRCRLFCEYRIHIWQWIDSVCQCVVHCNPAVCTITICHFYNAQTQTLAILFLRWLQAAIFKCEVLSMCPCWPSTMAFLRLWPPTVTPTWAVKTLTNASLSSQKPQEPPSSHSFQLMKVNVNHWGRCNSMSQNIRYASVIFSKGTWFHCVNFLAGL